MSVRRILLVARYALPAFLRNGSGISFVLVSFIIGLLLAQPVLRLYESGALGVNELLAQLQTIIAGVLAVSSLEGGFKTLFGGGAEAPSEYLQWAQFLINERPALLSATFALELIGVPLFIASGGFNLLSGDLQHGAVRYQLLRVSRREMLLGRYLAMATFASLVVGCMLGALTLYVGLTIDLYSTADLISWGLRGVLAFSILALPYVACCAMISANIASPFGSLVLCYAVIGGVPLLALAGRAAWEPLGNLLYIMPWGVTHHLFHPEWGHVLGAAAACVGYAAVYLVIGSVLFGRKDL